MILTCLYCNKKSLRVFSRTVFWPVSEISNEFSKRWVHSSHTHNFWWLYAFILILISYSYDYFSYSKLEVLIVLILNNMHDVVNWYTKHKICMIRVRTLQHLLEVCVFALFAVFVFFILLFFFCKCNNNCKFWWMIRVIRIIYKY